MEVGGRRRGESFHEDFEVVASTRPKLLRSQNADELELDFSRQFQSSSDESADFPGFEYDDEDDDDEESVDEDRFSRGRSRSKSILECPKELATAPHVSSSPTTTSSTATSPSANSPPEIYYHRTPYNSPPNSVDQCSEIVVKNFEPRTEKTGPLQAREVLALQKVISILIFIQ